MKRLLSMLFAAMLMLTSEVMAVAAPVAAVVRVERADRRGAASGVCVDPTGIVLTVKHVIDAGECTVHFRDGTSYAGRVVTESDLSDYPVAIRLGGVNGPLPYARIAESGPDVGEAVEYAGFPGAVKRNGRWIKYDEQRFTEIQSEVVSKNAHLEEDGIEGATAGDVRLFDIADPIYFGGSGGACFNAQDEVIGLVVVTGGIPQSMIPRGSGSSSTYRGSARDNYMAAGGSFTATKHVREVARQAAVVQPYQRKPSLLIFGYEECRFCKLALADAKAGRFAEYDWQYVDIQTPAGRARYDALVEAVEAATGQPVTPGVPAFHMEGRASMHVGYSPESGWKKLGQWAAQTFRLPLTIAQAVTGGAGRGIDPLPESTPDNPPEEQTPDASPPPAVVPDKPGPLATPPQQAVTAPQTAGSADDTEQPPFAGGLLGILLASLELVFRRKV